MKLTIRANVESSYLIHSIIWGPCC